MGRIGCPIALDCAQLTGRVGDRADRDFLRIEPNIRGPGNGSRRPRGDQQSAMAEIDGAELGSELILVSLGGEIGGASDAMPPASHAALGASPRICQTPGMPTDQQIAELAGTSPRAAVPSCSPAPASAPNSGIPDFRSPGGIWTRMAPIDFSDFLASEEARRETWRRRFKEDTFREARPNRGHRAVAELVRSGKVAAVITQNIDGLHQASGIADDRVIELHGNTTYAHCLDCKSRYELAALRTAFERDGMPRSATIAAAISKPRRSPSGRRCRWTRCGAPRRNPRGRSVHRRRLLARRLSGRPAFRN